MKKIQILGTGCPKCNKLYDNAIAAANESGIECDVEKVSDISKIMEAGVMMTPALVIDGEVVSSGKTLSPGEIGEMLKR